MSTNAQTLQNQYLADEQSLNNALAQQKADLAAYKTQLAADLSAHESPDEILATVMALISGYGLSAQEDNVSVTSSELNVNTDLGAISNDMQNQLNDALTARWIPNGQSGGMTVDQAGEMQADYQFLQTDLTNQMNAATPGSPAYNSAQTMLNALNDLNTQSDNFLGGGNGIGNITNLAMFYNATVANYCNDTGNQGGAGANNSAGALSSSFSDIATIKQTTGSTSTQLNAETQYQTQLIQTVETFINNGFQEIANLNKTFATNQITS